MRERIPKVDVLLNRHKPAVKLAEHKQNMDKLAICGSCEKCFSAENIPSCSELDVPLVIAINDSCPLEKW